MLGSGARGFLDANKERDVHRPGRPARAAPNVAVNFGEGGGRLGDELERISYLEEEAERRPIIDRGLSRFPLATSSRSRSAAAPTFYFTRTGDAGCASQ